MNGVKEMELVPAKPPQEETGSEHLVLMFERLAKDPAVDVEKLERLIAMQERIMRHNAKAAFDAAFAEMQPHIPVIDEHGRIEVKGTVRSTYAPLEDIHKVIKPICAQYGFAVRHRTEWPEKGVIRIVGILSHRFGHSEESVFEAPMDKSEYRTDIQSMGSTVSYGRRYTTIDLLNISTAKADNDGAGGRRQSQEPPPEGYDDWQLNMESAADEGWSKLSDALNRSKKEYRDRATRGDKQWWDRIKAKAENVTKKAAQR